jgi:hypothetical protein
MKRLRLIIIISLSSIFTGILIYYLIIKENSSIVIPDTKIKYKCDKSKNPPICIEDKLGTYNTNTCDNKCIKDPKPVNKKYTCDKSRSPYVCKEDQGGIYDNNECNKECDELKPINLPKPPTGFLSGKIVKHAIKNENDGREENDTYLRILTWNLKGISGGYCGGKNYDLMTTLIDNNGPYDLISFEEGQEGIIETVKNQKYLESIEFIKSVGIVYNKYRFELLSQGYIGVSGDQWGQRVLGFIKVKDRKTDKIIFFYAHHGCINCGSGCLDYASNWQGNTSGPCCGHKPCDNITKVADRVMNGIKESTINCNSDDIFIFAGDFQGTFIQWKDKFIGDISNCFGKVNIISAKYSGSAGLIDHIIYPNNKLEQSGDIKSWGGTCQVPNCVCNKGYESDHSSVFATLKIL